MDTIISGRRPDAERQSRVTANNGTGIQEIAEEAAPKIRVSLDISPELYAKLQGLAHDIRGTKSDVLRKSLALMDVAVQARKNGKKIGIADASEQLTTEIIGFEY